MVFTYKGVYIQREDSQALRKTFLGYRLTKCLFSFQEDLYRFQREGSTYNYKFSNVNAPKKGGWAETNLLFHQGEVNFLFLLCICPHDIKMSVRMHVHTHVDAHVCMGSSV